MSEAGPTAGRVPPHVRLTLLRLAATARSIRKRLDEQACRPGPVQRSWPWIRATLAGELQTATIHSLEALQALHEAVFASPSLVPVAEIGRRIDTMRMYLDQILALHREVAAALGAAWPLRQAVLTIVATPALQLADFFDRMRDALEAKVSSAYGTEIALAIDLEFGAQLAAAESASPVGDEAD